MTDPPNPDHPTRAEEILVLRYLKAITTNDETAAKQVAQAMDSHQSGRIIGLLGIMAAHILYLAHGDDRDAAASIDWHLQKRLNEP